MPLETSETLAIACDNPACPGNELDPANRTGWLFLTSELYGEGPTTTRVYCSPACVSADAEALAVTFEPFE